MECFRNDLTLLTLLRKGGKSCNSSYFSWSYSKFKDNFWMHLFTRSPKSSKRHMAKLWCNSLLLQLCVFYLNKDEKKFVNLCQFEGKWMSYILSKQTCTGHLFFFRNSVSDLIWLFFHVDLIWNMLCSIFLYMSESNLLLWTTCFISSSFLLLTEFSHPPKETVVLNSLTGFVPKRQSNSAEMQTVYVSAGHMPIISKGKIE